MKVSFKGYNRVAKSKPIIVLSFLLLFGIFFVGCSKKEEGVDTPQKIGENFLEQLFTSDYENRYTEFLVDKDLDKYYDTFSKYTSKKCLEKLEQDRMPIKYDKEAEKDDIFLNVSDVKIEFDKNGIGEFEVFLSNQENKDTILKKATGQITISESKKVDTFFLSNVVNIESENDL